MPILTIIIKERRGALNILRVDGKNDGRGEQAMGSGSEAESILNSVRYHMEQK